VLTPGRQSRWWLCWAAIPYRIGARVRALSYEQGWRQPQRLPVPVISVGNLTVGGTGKTPVVIELAQWLSAEGKKVAVLSRGYRRTSRAPVLLVSDGKEVLAGPDEAGDEPYLIARRCPQAVVAVGADRYALGRWVLERYPVDCVLLDDGFQHFGLHRDVNLLLIDATDADGLDDVLPVGRLREPLEAVKRATAIVVTRADDERRVDEVLARCRSVVDPLPPVVQVTFRPEALIAVASGQTQPPAYVEGKKAMLVSGIGHAGSFRATAEGLALHVLEETAYPDHHRYSREDVAGLRAKATMLNADVVVTTEKDAGKLAPYLTAADTGWWAVRLRLIWTHGESSMREMLTRGMNSGVRT